MLVTKIGQTIPKSFTLIFISSLFLGIELLGGCSIKKECFQQYEIKQGVVIWNNGKDSIEPPFFLKDLEFYDYRNYPDLLENIKEIPSSDLYFIKIDSFLSNHQKFQENLSNSKEVGFLDSIFKISNIRRIPQNNDTCLLGFIQDLIVKSQGLNYSAAFQYIFNTDKNWDLIQARYSYEIARKGDKYYIKWPKRQLKEIPAYHYCYFKIAKPSIFDKPVPSNIMYLCLDRGGFAWPFRDYFYEFRFYLGEDGFLKIKKRFLSSGIYNVK
jgi:hypothetical protein